MPRCERRPQPPKLEQTHHLEINGSASEISPKILCNQLMDRMQTTQQTSISPAGPPLGADTNPPPRARHEIHEKVRQLVSGLGSGSGKKALDAPLGPGTMAA